ncbi:hypothetical protein ACFQ9J_35600 [Streptomyces sp. NPDC056529]|uniref:hypothetical protein n=1 Tax=Streptomyces sp. NPDC056529 TaxID=3345855 RepID=UPI00367F7158
MVWQKLRATLTAAVRGRACDVVVHQQVAVPEELLGHEPADPEHDDQEQKPGCRPLTCWMSQPGLFSTLLLHVCLMAMP